MNLTALKRQTAKEGIRAAIIVGGTLFFYIGASTLSGSLQESQTRQQSALGQSQSEIALLRSKIESADSSQKAYSDLVRTRGNGNFEIDNIRVRDVLQSLVERYRLNFEGKLEYSAQQPFEDPTLLNLTNKFIVRREAKITFSAITDQHVYSFLEDLARELPGMVRYSKLTIRRTTEADDGVIANLSTGTPVDLVTADVSFDWYGLADPAEQSATAPQPGGPQ